MAEVYLENAGVGASPAKCRASRSRRIEMRRFAAAAAGNEPDPPLSPTSPASLSGRGDKRKEPEPETSSEPERLEKRSRVGEGDITQPQPLPDSLSEENAAASTIGAASCSRPAVVQAPEPAMAFGSVSLSGRSREMEDAVSLRPGFFRTSAGSRLHFFAVFDGHGGAHVSALCKERMHLMLAEELVAAAETGPAAAEEDQWRAAAVRSFARMDEMAMATCACGTIVPPPCGCELSGIESGVVGSTAATAVIGPSRILVANCGDSRAVLFRGGPAIPLSSDHKPDRPDELARIKALGGRVIFNNGARVNGILAMSRALGDKYLKPFVISEPEIMVMDRDPEDECLIIASDGLWDVLSNELACDVARRCLEEGDPGRRAEETSSNPGESSTGGKAEEYPSDERCSHAAALLARLALGRKSTDNISVIVIDLKAR